MRVNVRTGTVQLDEKNADSSNHTAPVRFPRPLNELCKGTVRVSHVHHRRPYWRPVFDRRRKVAEQRTYDNLAMQARAPCDIAS